MQSSSTSKQRPREQSWRGASRASSLHFQEQVSAVGLGGSLVEMLEMLCARTCRGAGGGATVLYFCGAEHEVVQRTAPATEELLRAPSKLSC